MNEILRLHDEVLLHFVQTDYFGRPWLGGAVVLSLLLLAPVHRRAARIVMALASLWVLITVGFYDAFRQVPVLASVTVLALVASWSRWIQWSVPEQASSGKAGFGLWTGLHPRGSWLDGLIRDYFRADPRGVYWLDLARVRRGRTPKRSAQERREAATNGFELSSRRSKLWQRVIFPLVEVRIWIWQRLPRYWLHEHEGLGLQETHVQNILQTEIAQATALAHEHEAGKSFLDYCQTTFSSAEHLRSLELAGCYAQKVCWLTEAWIESRLFDDVWVKGDERLCELADRSLELWRFRRLNERLWAHEVAASTQAIQAQKSSTAREVGGLADAARSGKRGSANQTGKSVDVSDEDELDIHLESDQESENVDEESFSDDTATEMEGNTIDDPVVEEQPRELAAKGRFFSGWKSLIKRRQKSPAADLAESTENELLGNAGEIPAHEQQREKLSSLEADRCRDLQLACALLEAFLDFKPQPSFGATVAASQRLFERPAHWAAATRLQMLYCLRPDFSGDHQERVKVETIGRLTRWVNSLAGSDDLVRSVCQTFFDLLMDWHSVRGGYTQIRELFAEREPRTPRQWEILGLAEAHMASQVRDRASFREKLVEAATAKLFQARVRGFWTQRYAGLLLGTNSSAETIQVLNENPVEFGRSEIDRAIDQSPPEARPDLKQVIGDVLDVDAPDERPQQPDPRTKKATPRSEPSRGAPEVPPTKKASTPRDPVAPTKPTRATSAPGAKEPPASRGADSGTDMKSKPAAGESSPVSKAPARKSPAAPSKPPAASCKPPAAPPKPPAARSKPPAAESPEPAKSKAEKQTPTLTLVFVQGKKRVSFKTFPVRFGSEEGERVIRSTKMEPLHCEITLDHGRIILVSHAPQNPAQVNSKPVKKAVELKHGDEISVVGMTFHVELS